MGMTTVNENEKGFEFDGESSKAFDLFITGGTIFDAPERDVEMIEIPGRNGAFVHDLGRFQNVTVTYKCALSSTKEHEFVDAMRKVRQWLCSKRGYCKLSDDFNPGEYRLAKFKDYIEVTNEAPVVGRFNLSFDCMPQRFLIDGDNPVQVASGDGIFNPTLFDAHPLLKVNGYGTISINGENVVLHNDPVGRVQLGGGTSYKNTITYTFDQSQFNTGDFITVPDYRRTFQFDMVKPYGSGEIIDFQHTSMTAVDYIFNATKYQGSLTLLTDASVFTVGTARTDSYNVIGKISYKNSSGTASEADFRAGASVAYDGNGSVTFTAFKFSTDASFIYTTVVGNAPSFYGDSTWQPVTDTAYIDLDIGEAYVINDGAVIGINNVAEIPAVLPVLKPAYNTVTFPNTVTKLEIVPRWWEV